MAPREAQLPGTRPTETERTVDEIRISPASDAFYAAARGRAEDTIEAQ